MYYRQTDYGPNPYVINVNQKAIENNNFRTALWTGNYMQMTLMSIPVRGEIGLEMHEDTEQMIRVEKGTAIVRMGNCQCRMDYQKTINEGDVVFVPAGVWHNIINQGKSPLKLSSIYSPPHHKRGTVHVTKADAKQEQY